MIDCNLKKVDISIEDSKATEVNGSRFSENSKVAFREGKKLEIRNSIFFDYKSVSG